MPRQKDDVDLAALDEARLYADNTEPIYRNRQAWVENIKRKMKRGVYERERMTPAIEKYFVTNVRKGYGKEYGDGKPLQMNKATRTALAKRFTRGMEDEARNEIDVVEMLKKRKIVKSPIFAKKGYRGIVDQETMFIAGEDGRERVHITPMKKRMMKQGMRKTPGMKLGGYGGVVTNMDGLKGFRIKGLISPNFKPSGLNLGVNNIGNIPKTKFSMKGLFKL